MNNTIDVAGPHFEDLRRGLSFGAPAVTLTAGHAAIYQATFGDRLMLPLDHTSSAAVTRLQQPLAHPLLVINIAIGQSTWVSQRVKANLFYRGLSLLKPVFIGDTLRTVTRVIALRRNQHKPGRPPSGMVGLEIVTCNQHGQEVLHFWRCPMIPCRGKSGNTQPGDDLDLIGSGGPRPESPDWNYHEFPAGVAAPTAALAVGSRLLVEARETVSSAPEFVRLTLNMAMAHTDIQHSHLPQRLVYGGHTIAVCFAQLTRALPRLLTMLSWERCDHIAPVTEGNTLRSEFVIADVVRHEQYEILTIQAQCFASRGEADREVQVLDWVFAVMNSTT